MNWLYRILSWIDQTIASMLNNKFANKALALAFCYNLLALFLTNLIAELSSTICAVPRSIIEMNPTQRGAMEAGVFFHLFRQIILWGVLFTWVHAPWMKGEHEQEKTSTFLIIMIIGTMIDATHDLGVVLGRLISAGLI